MSSIIFVNRFFYPDHSATSQMLSDIAFHIAGHQKKVKVITSRQLYDQVDVEMEGHEVISSVEVIRVWTTRFGRSNLVGRAIDYLTFYLSSFFCLLKTVTNGDIVIAKTDPPMISVVAGLVCSIKSAKLINWNQDLFPEVGTELGIKVLRVLKPLLLWIRNNSLKKAYKNIVLGERMRDKLLSFGVAPDKIAIIPNWSDGGVLYPVATEDNQYRHDWGLNDKFIVGYSGNMGRAHDFETILSIAGYLQEYEDIIFVFIGGGAKRAWLDEQVRLRGINNIIFKPYQSREKLSHSLSLPDIHIISLFPQLEGMIVPSKYYGVAAASRPCLFIGDKDGEISRILLANNCGASIGIGDVQAGIDYILRMRKQRDKCLQQGERARLAFLKNYDAKIAFGKWMRLLQI